MAVYLFSNVSYFLEKERALKDSRPRKKKRLGRTYKGGRIGPPTKVDGAPGNNKDLGGLEFCV